MLRHIYRALAAPALALFLCLPALAQEAIPSVPQEQYQDYMFPAPAHYGITGQTRIVAPVPMLSREGKEGPVTEFSVTGNVVDTYYLYLPEDKKHLNRIEVVSHYERAMRSYRPETLFRDEYNYYGRFTKEGTQYYIAVQVASKGAEYEVIIVEALM